MGKGKLFVLIATVLVILGLVKLGFWQLDRANEKEKLFTDYHQRDAHPVDLNQLEQPLESLQRFQPVTLSGLLQSQYLLLDNQVLDGQPGYHVIGLVAAAFPSGESHYVMLNMGWVPWGYDRKHLPDQLTLPTQETSFIGYFYEPELHQVWGVGGTHVEAERWPIRISALDAQAISHATGLSIQPFVVLLSESTSYGWPRQWKPQVMSPEQHRAYALQWFSLALVCAILVGFASRSRTTTIEE
ncbi:Cytochrome oxidase assembly protein ShyY1 [Pseudidiomarina indica]|uniref:SURF1-like protein n=1 Tax=Pseudidiomarina indica TaxID=1159017 RepID=A0A1G6CNR2_9GAMM|nr:SURF1 family protein [Pseudidiomarina indica]SDB34527.1 Cytochrome oxidase assembly protein ShyY1 [Pseudidiomarina indica]